MTLTYKVFKNEEYLDGQCRELIASISRETCKLEIKIDTVLDCGAHVGFFSLPLASCGCRVIAVEPALDTMAKLLENIATNGLDDRVIPICASVGDTASRIVTLYGYGALSGGIGKCSSIGPLYGYSVVIDLDELLAKWPSKLVKIDVQGMEHEIFGSLPMGALDGVSILYVEGHDVENPLYHQGIKAVAIDDIIRSHGFDNTETEGLWVRR